MNIHVLYVIPSTDVRFNYEECQGYDIFHIKLFVLLLTSNFFRVFFVPLLFNSNLLLLNHGNLLLLSLNGVYELLVAGNEKQSTNVHLEELEDPDTFSEEEIKVISHREYVSHLYELKDEINHAWKADNRVASLKLSIKVLFFLKPFIFELCLCVFPYYRTSFLT